jgi:S1-C subfamily serine protease
VLFWVSVFEKEAAGMRLARVAAFLAFACAISLLPPAFGAEEPLAAATISRMADLLGDRQLAPPDETAGGVITRGASLRDLYRATVRAVPIVVAQDGTGSSIVISLNRTESWGLVVTNRHVVEKPFRTDKGEPRVLLLFYDPHLAGEPFSPDKIQQCIQVGEKGPFCDALRKSLRIAAVLGTDPARDLALLYVEDVPAGVTPIQEASLETVEPGDDVAVVGHPKGFLWSLTRGIVSAIRSKYPMGESQGTVIQTQTPIAPGNSGGPLLTMEGRLVGVITWQLAGSQGLNGAIAVNEVQEFAAELAAKSRKQ